jgi:hypothetical protein
MSELLPQATFYSQVVNRGILGHYVATASLVTGAYERFNNFAEVAPEHPTIFEYVRRQLHRPPEDAWVIAPSNGFNRIGQSIHPPFQKGSGYGAGVILPKRMLEALPASHTAGLGHLLQDNYETAFEVPQAQFDAARLNTIETLLKLSIVDFAAHASTLESPDELSVYLARRLMREVSPSLIWITLHDMDVAHAGAFSLYIDAIQRTDRLCAEIWKAVEAEPEYKDKTNLFIMPDFGRDSDTDAGGNGFQHHRTGSPMARTTWMVVMGPGVHQGKGLSPLVYGDANTQSESWGYGELKRQALSSSAISRQQTNRSEFLRRIMGIRALTRGASWWKETWGMGASLFTCLSFCQPSSAQRLHRDA